MQRDENRAEIFGLFWKKIWKQSTDIETKTEIQGREAEMAKISRGNRNPTVCNGIFRISASAGISVYLAI
jgi:hypothetical protein